MMFRRLVDDLRTLTPINWGLNNFLQLMVVQLTLMMFLFVFYYQARGEMLLPVEVQAKVLRSWLMAVWVMLGYLAFTLLLWVVKCCFVVADWLRARK